MWLRARGNAPNDQQQKNKSIFSLGEPLTLVVLTLFCLLPFSGKAFHIDDPLFLWSAKHILRHPLNPYGFDVVWSASRLPMSEATQNPPLASYYAALVGWLAGWSERALHLGFVLPALAAILGTYRLAGRFTRQPMLAAMATLLAPGLLVSATGVMCDTTMVALWIWAVIFWVEGLDGPQEPLRLALSSLLIAACALTKYYGVSLVPLLFAYSIARKRGLQSWVWFLLLPIAILGVYETWSRSLYGHGLLSFGMHYTASSVEGRHGEHFTLGHVLVGLAFAGGCALPALTFVPFLWSRKQLLVGGVVSALLTLAYFEGWTNLGTAYPDQEWIYQHAALVNGQLLLCLSGGISVFALAMSGLWKRRDAPSLLLLLWIVGTFLYAVLVNWQVNARSLLPLIPAVAILIAQRLDEIWLAPARWQRLAVIVPLLVSGAVSLWAAWGDEELANTARTMANYVHLKYNAAGPVSFEGHWGFQYYMELLGARPLENSAHESHVGDLVVFPLNNANLFDLSSDANVVEIARLKIDAHAGTMTTKLGAGFYSSDWGPLPFAIGPVPDERYYVLRMKERHP